MQIYIMWVLYAVASILHAFLSAVYAHSYVYITSFSLIVSYSIKSQSSELVHSFTKDLVMGVSYMELLVIYTLQSGTDTERKWRTHIRRIFCQITANLECDYGKTHPT